MTDVQVTVGSEAERGMPGLSWPSLSLPLESEPQAYRMVLHTCRASLFPLARYFWKHPLAILRVLLIQSHRYLYTSQVDDEVTF